MPSTYAHRANVPSQAAPPDGFLCPGHRLLEEMKRQNNGGAGEMALVG